jgi:hypothetical protein
MKPTRLLATLAAALSACGGPSDKKVGGFSNDLLGNEIAVEALRDPKRCAYG